MDASLIPMACQKCNTVLCHLPAGRTRLGTNPGILKAAKRAHYRHCPAVVAAKQPTDAKCPVCQKVMRKNNLPRHCATVHRQEMIDSMPASDLMEMKKHKTPFIFGYHNNKRIIGCCLVCLKGGINIGRDHYNLEDSYREFEKRHALCSQLYEEVKQSGPRKQFTHTIIPFAKAPATDSFKPESAPSTAPSTPPSSPSGSLSPLAAPPLPASPPSPPPLDLRNDVVIQPDLNDERLARLEAELAAAREECLKAKEEAAAMKEQWTRTQHSLIDAQEACIAAEEEAKSRSKKAPVLRPKTEKAMLAIADEEGIYWEPDSRYDDICSYVFDDYVAAKKDKKTAEAQVQKAETRADEFAIIVSNLMRALDDEQIPIGMALTPAQQKWLRDNL